MYHGDGEGQCSCVCEDERWSDHNLLGRASCVPVMAHVIFGWVGLALSAAALCQAAYHLYRQLKFHAQEFLASVSPVETCHRLLHLLVVTFSIVCLVFFCMVLRDELRWSGVLASAMQIPSNIGGVMAIRIWIYTTGDGLGNRSPEMLTPSSWLETPVGHYAVGTAVSTVPSAAIILAVADHPVAAVKMTPSGILFVGSIVACSFWVRGKSLFRVIDESMEQRKERGVAKHGDDGDQTLLAAINKVKRTLGFAA